MTTNWTIVHLRVANLLMGNGRSVTSRTTSVIMGIKWHGHRYRRKVTPMSHKYTTKYGGFALNNVGWPLEGQTTRWLAIFLAVKGKSRLRATITQTWYYVSHRHDTSFEASFRHRKQYLADMLSLDPCNTLCIHSKIPFQIIFRAKKS